MTAKEKAKIAEFTALYCDAKNWFNLETGFGTYRVVKLPKALEKTAHSLAQRSWKMSLVLGESIDLSEEGFGIVSASFFTRDGEEYLQVFSQCILTLCYFTHFVQIGAFDNVKYSNIFTEQEEQK